jgi:branched-chain amino acid transport system substrate-binding protein
MIKKLLQFFVLILLILPQAALADTTPLRIGALIVLSGQYAMQGNAFREGMELAVSEINARGGIHGRKLELVVEDTGNLPVKALTASRRLLQLDGLIAAMTASYPELATGASEFQRRKIPVVHLWDASPDIEAMGEYIFGIGPWTPSAGEVSATFAIRNLASKKAVTLYIHDPWSQLVTGYFEKQFKALGGTILQSHGFNPQEQDFRAVFSKIRALKPDVIYCPIGDNIVPFYTQLRQQISDIPIISSDVIAEEHVRQAPTAFEGIYQSQMKDPHGEELARLSAIYSKKFNRPVALPWFVATAYDGVKLIASCAANAGPTPGDVRDCVAATTNFPGISQTLSFNPGGSSPQIESIFQIHNGRFAHQSGDLRGDLPG